jgi:signal transduction histidine kinase
MPRPTVRLRLTLLYGSLFLIAGALLLGITYGLASQHVSGSANVSFLLRSANVRAKPVPGGFIFEQATNGSPASGASPDSGGPLGGAFPAPTGLPAQIGQEVKGVQRLATAQARVDKSSQLSSLLVESAIALAIMSIVSILLGWLVAGRVLAPVRTMNTRMRQISEHNLHERLALGGRDDELQELGDTFDELLGRLESAFESQRRFVANASHELRTPVTVERALVEVALADPHATVDSLRETCGRVLVAGEQQERTIEALLTLARSQRGLQLYERVDLAEVGAEALAAHDGAVKLEGHFEPSAVSGDPGMLERLVGNLVDNAVHHNVPGGWVSVSTGVRADGRATLEVANSGPAVPAENTAQLLEPFRRLNGDRTTHAGGVGLGLSIVDAIATAHGADLELAARPEGGLDVLVAFPPIAA